MAYVRVPSLIPSHRTALMLGCSVIALAATAGTKVSAQQVYAGYTYNVAPNQSSINGSSATSIDYLPQANDGFGNSVFGHDYGQVGGSFGSRSSGTGQYSINGYSEYKATFTNTTGIASDYTLTYVLQNGQVSVSAPASTSRTELALGTAVITATYDSGNSTTLLNYSVSLKYNSANSASPVFSETGLVLQPSGPTLSANSGDYSWGTFTGTVDLGVLAPGASAAVDYRIDTRASGGQPALLLAQSNLLAVVGYGGYGGPLDGATARFGDPFSGSGAPAPFVITASAVPEPASLAVLGAGLAGLALARRRPSAA